MTQGEQYYKYLRGDIFLDLATRVTLELFPDTRSHTPVKFYKNIPEEEKNLPNIGQIEVSDDPEWDIKILVTKQMTQILPPGQINYQLTQELTPQHTILKHNGSFMHLQKPKTS